MRRTACLCLVLSLFLAAGCRKPAAPAAGDGGDPAAPAAGPEESLLDGWVRRLRTQEPRAQAEAVAAIVQIHQAGDDVVPALLAALKDRGTHGPGVWFPGEPNSTREAVVMTLLKLGPAGEAVVETGVVPALAEGLADADAAVREHSAYA
ncbi:MAG TPA: hypothetical protein VIL46_05240, partial [Gemmataceae bacterium]